MNWLLTLQDAHGQLVRDNTLKGLGRQSSQAYIAVTAPRGKQQTINTISLIAVVLPKIADAYIPATLAQRCVLVLSLRIRYLPGVSFWAEIHRGMVQDLQSFELGSVVLFRHP